jgi:GTPase
MDLQKLLDEGSGETIYEISVKNPDGSVHGLSDQETETTLQTLRQFHVSILPLRHKKDTPTTTITEVLLRRLDRCLEVRVAVVGNVDAGKSTLLGVLATGNLDDGRGSARSHVFRHKHEIESGRTSSISHQTINFDQQGVITSDGSKATKMINLIDLAGHQRYFGTTVYGMTGHQPDYTMLIVGSNMGLVGTTREHLGLSMALRIPVFVVVTKIDLCPPNILKETLDHLQRILKSSGCHKIPFMVRNLDDLMVCARNFITGRITPIFCVSSVTGNHLDDLRQFLHLLPLNKPWDVAATQPFEMPIDSVWQVMGFGTVVCGTVMKGIMKINDTVLLGPLRDGSFMPVTYKSLYCQDRPANQAVAGQSASVSLRKIDRKDLRPGMVLVAPSVKPVALWEFEADLIILYHSTTITVGYESMLHCGGVKQTVRLIHMDQEVIRTGSKSHVRFRFLFHPEYLTPETRFIIRDGNAKGVGKVGGEKRGASPPFNKGGDAPPATPSL